MIKAVVTNWEWKRLFVINFPSGTTVLECGELDMIWIEETVVKMDRSRNQHHVNIIVTIVTVKIYHYSLIHKSLKMIVGLFELTVSRPVIGQLSFAPVSYCHSFTPLPDDCSFRGEIFPLSLLWEKLWQSFHVYSLTHFKSVKRWWFADFCYDHKIVITFIVLLWLCVISCLVATKSIKHHNVFTSMIDDDDIHQKLNWGFCRSRLKNSKVFI